VAFQAEVVSWREESDNPLSSFIALKDGLHVPGTMKHADDLNAV
jgi:hypothetical protein